MQDAVTSTTANWRYFSERDHHCSDGYKIEHYAVNDQTGQRCNLDFTPYHEMPRNTFAKLVEMGFPPRPDMSPWTAGGVNDAYKAFQRRETLIPLVTAAQTVAALVVLSLSILQFTPAVGKVARNAFTLAETAAYARPH